MTSQLTTIYDQQPFLELRIWSATFYQLQRQRIMISNRLRSGVLPPDVVNDLLADVKATEDKTKMAMRKSFRRACPELVAWIKTDQAVGIGEHLIARLLGTIGHPLVAIPSHWEGTGSARVLVTDEPYIRSIAQLRAYCGYGDPTRRRRAGQSAEESFRSGNPLAKMLLRLISEGTMKCTGGKPSPFSVSGDDELPDESTGIMPKPTSMSRSSSVDSSGSLLFDSIEAMSRATSKTEPASVEPSESTEAVSLPTSANLSSSVDSPSLFDSSGMPETSSIETRLAPTSRIPTASVDSSTSSTEAMSQPTSDSHASSVDLSTSSTEATGPPTSPTANASVDSSDTAIGKGIKRRSPYRDLYDESRLKYAEREDWTLGHQHNAALRRVAKEIIKDIWIVCNDSHQARENLGA